MAKLKKLNSIERQTARDTLIGEMYAEFATKKETIDKRIKKQEQLNICADIIEEMKESGKYKNLRVKWTNLAKAYRANSFPKSNQVAWTEDIEDESDETGKEVNSDNA